MQFLKTLFWVVLAVVAVIFAIRNEAVAPVYLWGGVTLDFKVYVLVFGGILLGFLPTFGWHRASRWRMQRRIESHERALADMRGIGQMTASEALAPSVAGQEPPIAP
jgi:uncharacterized integral membrane protein